MIINFLAGCIGGCAGVVVGYPLDTVKVHMQTQDPTNPVYKNTLHCTMTLLRQDGLGGLYRGITSAMMCISFIKAIAFGIYGSVQQYTTDPEALSSHLVAAASAGFCQSIVCAPMELAKTRLQLQNAEHKGVRHRGPIDCLHYIIRNDGLKAGFRGLGITAARDVPGYCAYFITFEVLSQLPPNPNATMTLVAGGVAGINSWVIAYPVDVVKTCLQADGMSVAPEYKGALDCALKNYRKYGSKFFFRGLSATILQAFPTHAACFFVVSTILNFTGPMH